ncbi:MAG: hypothetical protein QM755_07620 [Luteolibacter sp.]
MKILTSLLLAFAAPAGAAVLVSTSFTGVTATGATLNNIVWTSNSHFTPSITATVVGATAYQTTNSLNNGQVTPSVNVQTAAVSPGTPVWTMDFSVAYALTNTADTISLQSISFNGITRDSTSGVQQNARYISYTASIVSSTGTVLATGSLEQQIPANSSTGLAYTINLSGDVELSSADLGGDAGSYTIRISANKPSSEALGAFAGIDNLALNGTYNVVPEPSVAILGLVGALGILRRRR